MKQNHEWKPPAGAANPFDKHDVQPRAALAVRFPVQAFQEYQPNRRPRLWDGIEYSLEPQWASGRYTLLSREDGVHAQIFVRWAR